MELIGFLLILCFVCAVWPLILAAALVIGLTLAYFISPGWTSVLLVLLAFSVILMFVDADKAKDASPPPACPPRRAE